MPSKKRSRVEEKLLSLRAIVERASPSLATELRPFVRDPSGAVVAAAANVAGEHELRDLAGDLEEAFERLLVDPVKSDPGCRAKIAAAEALRKLDAHAPGVFLRGVSYVQREPSFGGAVDTAGPLRISSAAGLLQVQHAYAFVEIAPLLADPEPNVRAGVAVVIGGTGVEAADALLRLKVRSGDREPEVVGACLKGLLASSTSRHLAFVLEAMKDADGAAVQLALLALGETHDERVVAPLCEYVETASDADLRAAALLGLSLSRLGAANEYLVGMVENASEGRAIEALRALAAQKYDATLVGRVRGVARERGGRVSEAMRAALEG